MGKPTDKMIAFAFKIHIYAPDGESPEEMKEISRSYELCSEYISKYKHYAIEEWHRRKNTYTMRSRRRYRNYESVDGNPFGVPGGENYGVDCTDFGIYPWGDS